MPALGTRTKATVKYDRLAQGNLTRGFTRDLGMTKRVTATLTFSASTGRLTGANGTFPITRFIVDDPVWIEAGAALNGGDFFTIVGLDATNHAFLVLDPPPKSEGPLTITLRTP